MTTRLTPGRPAALPAIALLMAAPLHAGEGASMSMPGLYGTYDMARESSGTSWQPDSTPPAGLSSMRGDWMLMLHGAADGIYDDQGGPRGNTQTFSESWLMFMARRELPRGAFGLHLMGSLDPVMGSSGYPLLLQTGETANGRDPLIDRQHPHNLLMELAATWSHDLAPASSWFVYAGLPGEPALGPSAFMHRLSGADNPEAPLTHHWLDSTHVAFGVVTLGYVWQRLKLETSAFNGREPDQHRYTIEVRPLDSYAGRLTVNPSDDLSLQLSAGRLASPEQLAAGVSVRRTTASLSYNARAPWRWWQTTLAWGHNTPSAGPASSGWLLESAARISARQTLFARAERVAKDELFLPGAPLAGGNFTVEKLSAGYIFDFGNLGGVTLGAGGLMSAYSYPPALDPAYGERPISFMLFVRARL